MLMKSFAVILQATADQSVPVSNGYLLFASLCALFRGTELDQIFHSHEKGVKGISLSPLFAGNFSTVKRNSAFQLKRGMASAFKINFIHDDVADVFAEIMERNHGRPLRVGGAGFQISQLCLPGEHPYAQASSPQQLTPSAPPLSVGLQVLTPAGFKVEGKQFFLPDAKVIYGGLLRKWRELFAASAWGGLENEFAAVELEYFQIESRAVRFKADRIFRGFCGEISFSLRTLSPENAAAVAALNGLAFFTGLGYKTSQGMGTVLPYSRS